ncbi:MAG: HNH endonuclease [Chloroflexi bacterium]|nr:HNH endonuclease [Chloroflexota bacterium]
MQPGDVISYLDMCREEGANLQRGMNFHFHTGLSVILMSLRKDAPYGDRIEENGKVLIYEGHDASRITGGPNPKTIDQPLKNSGGSPTQNGSFYKAAVKYRSGEHDAELVKVYEKIQSGIWAYNGIFRLIDSWQEVSDNRKVFKFRLELTNEHDYSRQVRREDIEHNRIIPTAVKLTVWKRDKGRCVICGSTDNLHFDHIIPYSKGGSSLVAENIQLLCVRHNLEKRDKIE